MELTLMRMASNRQVAAEGNAILRMAPSWPHFTTNGLSGRADMDLLWSSAPLYSYFSLVTRVSSPCFVYEHVIVGSYGVCCLTSAYRR